MIFGENTYEYWVSSETHFVIPTELEPDIYHRNQTLTARAIPIQNSSRLKVRVRDDGYLKDGDITFFEVDSNNEISRFEILYYEKDVSFLPFGGLMIVEYEDYPIVDFECWLFETRLPKSFTIRGMEYDFTTFVIEKGFDEGDFGRHEIRCEIRKIKDRDFKTEKIFLTFIPEDFYVDEDNQLKLGFEDEEYNVIRDWRKEVEVNIAR